MMQLGSLLETGRQWNSQTNQTLLALGRDPCHVMHLQGSEFPCLKSNSTLLETKAYIPDTVNTNEYSQITFRTLAASLSTPAFEPTSSKHTRTTKSAYSMPCLDFFKHLMPRLLPVTTRPRYMSSTHRAMASLSHRSSPPESLPLLAGILQDVTNRTHRGHKYGFPLASLWRLTASESESTPPIFPPPCSLAWVSGV